MDLGIDLTLDLPISLLFPRRSREPKMKVTVCFGNTRVIVPCGNGDIPVNELVSKVSPTKDVIDDLISYSDMDRNIQQNLAETDSES